MSRKQFVKELLDKIQNGETLANVAVELENSLKKQEELWTKYKQWSTIIVLFVSVLYNVLQTLGIW